MTRIVDLFSGWGGFSLGAEMAGARVVWAGNHWPLAVRAHEMNHPSTVHVCQDLRQADWSALPAHEGLVAGPACPGYSTAAQPARKHNATVRARHEDLRTTPWAVVDCAEETRPRFAVVENVVAFRRWPLFGTWCEAWRILGYDVHEHVVRASLTGVPQRRDRLFVIATRVDVDLSGLHDARETPFGPCIDWGADARWSRVADASPRVRERVAKGRRNHGRRFLTQHVTGHPGVGLDEPIRTITTKDQWAIVDGARYRPLTLRENARAMGFPDSYGWPAGVRRRDVVKGLGNAVCPPVARRLVERFL